MNVGELGRSTAGLRLPLSPPSCRYRGRNGSLASWSPRILAGSLEYRLQRCRRPLVPGLELVRVLLPVTTAETTQDRSSMRVASDWMM